MVRADLDGTAGVLRIADPGGPARRPAVGRRAAMQQEDAPHVQQLDTALRAALGRLRRRVGGETDGRSLPARVSRHGAVLPLYQWSAVPIW